MLNSTPAFILMHLEMEYAVIKGKYMKYTELNLSLFFRLHLYAINHYFIITIKQQIVCLCTFSSLLNHLRTDHCRNSALLLLHTGYVWEYIQYHTISNHSWAVFFTIKMQP